MAFMFWMLVSLTNVRHKEENVPQTSHNTIVNMFEPCCFSVDTLWWWWWLGEIAFCNCSAGPCRESDQ